MLRNKSLMCSSLEISEFSEKIQKFSNHNLFELSNKFECACRLDEFSSFAHEIETFEKNIDEYNKNLEQISKEDIERDDNLRIISEKVLSILNDFDEIKEKLKNKLDLKAPQLNSTDYLEITEASPLKENTWKIKIKSNSKTQDYKDVSIWDLENNQIICNFDLIEPDTEVKLYINTPLTTSHHLIGKIGEKTVSFPYKIPKVKIQNKKIIEDKMILEVKNLSDEYINNAYCYIQGNVACNITLEPFSNDSFSVPAQIDKNTPILIFLDKELIS